MQLHGQIVAIGDVLGIVKSTGTATLHQPDRVRKDPATGEIVERTARPDLEVQTATVAWENGTESTLTEHLHSWDVLGSVQAFPDPKSVDNPPPGAGGELEDQQAATDAAVADVAAYAAELRAAAPLVVSQETERVLVDADDGELTVA
jgi:hypothetical protein